MQAPELKAFMTELILIRHGETEWNAEGRIQGHTDIPLNATGLAQARAVGERFRVEHVDAIVSSDLQRAMQTAQPIAQSRSLVTGPEPALRERHLGVLQGLTGDEARERAAQAWRTFKSRTPAQPLPEGESLADFAARAVAALKAIALRYTGQRIAVVTHGGVLDAAYREAAGMPLDAPRDFPVFNASVNTLSVTDGRFRVVRWADVSHLPSELAMDDD